MTDRQLSLLPLAIVVYLTALAVALASPGCGASARQQRLAVIEATAVTVGAAGDAVALAATADAASTCPAGVPDLTACLAPVRLRWAPADAVLDGLRLALGTWLVSEELGDGSDLASQLGPIITLYADLVAILAPLGVALPPLVGAP